MVLWVSNRVFDISRKSRKDFPGEAQFKPKSEEGIGVQVAKEGKVTSANWNSRHKYFPVEGSIAPTSTGEVGWFGWEERTKAEAGVWESWRNTEKRRRSPGRWSALRLHAWEKQRGSLLRASSLAHPLHHCLILSVKCCVCLYACAYMNVLSPFLPYNYKWPLISPFPVI